MANEIPRIEKWLYAALAGDSAISAAIGARVFNAIAPQGTAFPFVIFNFQAGTDVQGNGTARVQSEAVFLVKVVSQGPPDATARTVADRIDEVVGKAVHAALDSYLFSGRRESPFRFVEAVGDVRFHHVGGLYRITTYPQ